MITSLFYCFPLGKSKNSFSQVMEKVTKPYFRDSYSLEESGGKGAWRVRQQLPLAKPFCITLAILVPLYWVTTSGIISIHIRQRSTKISYPPPRITGAQAGKETPGSCTPMLMCSFPYLFCSPMKDKHIPVHATLKWQNHSVSVFFKALDT
jgi:hypothetical protein